MVAWGRQSGGMNEKSSAARTVATVGLPALIGGLLGMVAALVLPRGDQGDVLSVTPASAKS